MLTYAQNFEDVMLERLFKEVQSGFYVDIGAWDPTAHSVTRHFYDRGWRGVNVEPISQRCRLFDAERSRDINLNKAIGPQPGSMVFFECLEESYLSTLNPEVATAMRERGLTVQEHTVEVVTLADIFEVHCPETVDFLKIDVEGFEGELLKSFDLTRYRPRALVVEATIPSTAPSGFDHLDEIGTWQGWEPDVLAQGYQLVHFDGLNRFYLRSEDVGLARRLALPPCIFDEIEHAPTVEQIKALTDDRAAKEEVIGRLEGELEGVRGDRAAKEEVVGRLEGELEAVREDNAAKQGVIDRLGQELGLVREDNAAKQSVI
ncbi:FkbM family methyltransferase, partial [Azospirillum himalayense]